MSEKSEKLFEAIGEVRDDLLDEAARPERMKKKSHWIPYGAVAAALLVAVGLGTRMWPEMGGAQSPGSSIRDNETSAPADAFMSYAGPILSLTLAEPNETIAAERTLTLDFSPWEPVWISNEEQLEQARELGATADELEKHAEELKEWYPEGGYYERNSDLFVKDAYILTNTSDKPQEVELLYPFVSGLMDYRATLPELNLEGESVKAQVRPGAYAGGFRGAGGAYDHRQLNLSQPTSWEEYRTLLADGSYRESALEPGADLSGKTAVVYKFTDAWGPERSDAIPNPSVRVSFDLDYDQTSVLSYGFHSASFDRDSGWMGRGYSIPQDFRWDKDHPKYLVMVGEDVENMQTAFFATGGWDPELEVEGGVTVERYEAPLDTILREIAGLMFEGELRGEQVSVEESDFELYYASMVDWLLSYGLLSEQVVERYEFGMLGESDFAVVDRVFYLQSTVTIPAGESVLLTASCRKEASYDFYCGPSERVGLYGYDAIVGLDSNLNFTAQTAKVEDRGQIVIEDQNFGFDLEFGRRETALESGEHYYLNVRRPETGK